MPSYPPRPTDPRVGKTLSGKWKLDRLIGVGGMASVYAATHRNGQLAAIKVLHPQFARHAEARTRFLREAYIANKAGPGAVEVKDDDVDDDGAPYLIMELLRGQPVDRRADEAGGRLDVADVLWVASQTLATLEIAHDNGIVHRDLKPENLFWTNDGRIKVLDFGIARLRDATIEETTRSGMVLGTPNFMSPEQALGAEEIDARTDIWAVGAIMYRLLTGRDVHPPGANVLVAAATQHAPSVALLAPSLPDPVVDIVDRALKFERDERFATAHQMRDEVDRCADVDAFDATIPAARAVPQVPDAPPSSPGTAFPSPEEESGLATNMSDDDSMALRELLGLVELALRSRAEFGPSHPQAIRNVDQAYRNAVKALSKAHIGLFWNVIPQGFVARRQRELLWRAKPPLPASPEMMFAGGVRMLGLLPEIKPEEFEALVRLVGGDVTPFTDFATFLQSGRNEHIVYRLEPTVSPEDHDSISLDPSPGGVNVPQMLDALTTCEPAMRATLLDRLERWGDGHEAQIAKVLEAAGVDLAMGLLRVLSALGTDEAREAMLLATKNRHSVVRVEALSRLQAGHQRFHAELREMFQETDPKARLETLVGIEKYRIEVAGPALAQRIRSPSFDTLPIEERQQALSTLGALLPSRAEGTAIEMLYDRRSASQEAREVSRELACDLLGRVGSSQQARDALEAVAKGQDRSSDRVRAAATRAIASFDARAAATPRKSEPPARPVTKPPVRMNTRPPPAMRPKQASRPPPPSRPFVPPSPSARLAVTVPAPRVAEDGAPPAERADELPSPPPKRTVTHQRLPKVTLEKPDKPNKPDE